MTLPSPDGPTSSSLLEVICADLQARWAANERIPVEHYLLRHPELSAEPGAVLELALLEVALREEAGERPALAELTSRFPALSEPFQRQMALHGLFSQLEAPAATGDESDPAKKGFCVADYVLVREIGRGGMGTVYEAHHRHLNRRVAIKMLPGIFAPGAHELERFATEAEALTRLQHPHIVGIHEVGLHQSQPFIAFELIEGGTLAERIRQEPLTPRASATLVATLAWAVEAVHQHGIVHRDLKPANVLLIPGKETELGVPKIADFGLAKLLDHSTQLTRSGDVLGTPAYLAPEQVSGHKEIGPAADVYGLGAILYEMLTRRPPFRGTSAAETLWQVAHRDPLPPWRIRSDIPRDLQTICLKCLEKVPRRRYLTAAALAEDLERWLRGEPIRARPLGLVGHWWRLACRNPMAATLLLGLLLALIGGFVGITWNWREAERLAAAESAERRKAETNLYRSRVAQAALLWQSNNVAGALEQLDLCAPANGKPDLRGWEWHYLRRLCNTEDYALPQPYWVQAMAVSPDGRELAVATGEPANDPASNNWTWPGELVVWDLAEKPSSSDVPVIRWRQGNTAVRAVAYSPDGRWLVWGTANEVRLLDRASGRVQHLWKEPGLVWSVCFRGDSQHLACACMTDLHACIHVYDVASRQQLAERTDADSGWWCQHVSYSPDGRWLACQRPGRCLILWDPLKNEEKRLEPCRELNGLAFLAQGRWLASVGAAGGIVWDAATGREFERLSGHNGLVCALDVAPDGRHLATAGADQTVRLWDGTTGQEMQVLRGHTWTIRSVAFTADGGGLFSGGQDRMVKRWNVTRQQRGRLLTSEDRLNDVAFAPEGRIRAVRLGGQVRTWAADETVTDSQCPDMTAKRGYPISYAAFLPGGEAVVSISRDNPQLLKIWDAATGRERLALRGHTLPVHVVAVSADGRCVVSAAWDLRQPETGSEIKVWDVATGVPRASFAAANVVAMSLALSPDGQRVALGERARDLQQNDASANVSLWNLNGQRLAVRNEHQQMVTSVAFSPDGRLLASVGFADAQVCLRDAADLHVLQGTPGPHAPTCVCFDPAGRRLAVIGYQGIVHLLDAEDGQEVMRLPGLVGNRDDDSASDARVRFSADGQWLLSTNWDSSVNVWNGLPLATRP
jgi:eukaryotic-like serine/threonine-protein kinase